MALTRIFLDPTEISSQYTFDANKIDWNNSNPTLKKVYPSNQTFYASFLANLDADFSLGNPVGTVTPTVAVSGNKAVFNGGRIDYAGALNIGDPQKMTVVLMYTPDYTGSPAANKPFWSISNLSGSFTNLCALQHMSTGQLRLSIFSSVGGAIVGNVDLGLWAPVNGQTYFIELDTDSTTGAHRVFIDGAQFGATQTGTGTRTAVGLLRLGRHFDNSGSMTGSYSKFQIYNTILHTSNFTPQEFFDFPTDGPTIKAVVPLNTSKILSMVLNASFNVGTNAKFYLELTQPGGVLEEKYWDGAAWVDSDESVLQSTNYDALIDWAALEFASGSIVNFVWHLITNGPNNLILFHYIVQYESIETAVISGFFFSADSTPLLVDDFNVLAYSQSMMLFGEHIQATNRGLKAEKSDGGVWSVTVLVGFTYLFVFYDKEGFIGSVEAFVPAPGNFFLDDLIE